MNVEVLREKNKFSNSQNISSTMLLDDFDDIEEEEENERIEMKGNGRRRKRRGSYVMPSDFALANDDGSENEKSDDVRFFFMSPKRKKRKLTHTKRTSVLHRCLKISFMNRLLIIRRKRFSMMRTIKTRRTTRKKKT